MQAWMRGIVNSTRLYVWMYVPDYHGFKSNDIYWSIITSDEFESESDKTHPDVSGEIFNSEQTSSRRDY